MKEFLDIPTIYIYIKYHLIFSIGYLYSRSFETFLYDGSINLKAKTKAHKGLYIFTLVVAPARLTKNTI